MNEKIVYIDYDEALNIYDKLDYFRNEKMLITYNPDKQ